jgi:tartrate dehydratase alpha subunit/fumarate hydratase class I-like protein
LTDGKEEIMSAMKQFEKMQEKYLPKVDRKLVVDLFLRLREDPNDKPMYTMETFIEKGTNSEEIRNEIIRDTGMAPQFFDKGTHVVVHHKLDYDLLKLMNDHPGVVEIRGTYMGSMASTGASYDSSANVHTAEGY